MRNLVIFLIIVCGVLYYLNGHYLPSKQRQAKEIVDRHINSMLIGNINEKTYTAHVVMYPTAVYVENLYIDAGFAKWDRIEFREVLINIERIDYDPQAAIWQSNREISGIGKVDFQAVLNYDQIAVQLDENNENLVDVTVRYDGGHIFLRAYFSPYQDKLEFDGDFVLTPKGEIKYQISKIVTVDGEEQRSSRVRKMVDDTLVLTVPVYILDRPISFNELEILNNGVWISGEYEGDIATEENIQNGE